MSDNKIANSILKYDLCIGCGLCSSIFGQDNCEMKLAENGFYRPLFKNRIIDKTLKDVCPGIRVHCDSHNTPWGNVTEVVEGWAKDNYLRHKAASGGVVTSIAVSMLETGQADAILQVGSSEGSYLYNELKVSRSKEEVISNAQSRYAPALSLAKIKQILDSSKERFVFVGKPCDIAGVKNMIDLYPTYNGRIVLFISIFCAGMPSYRATEQAWKLSGRDDEPEMIKYRGDGWPGFFKVTWKDGQVFKLSYNESWGKVLGRQLGYRCKICPDGIGMLADIAVGDSWNTKDGYPEFSEDEGRSFVFVRNNCGKYYLELAQKGNYLEYKSLPIERIRDMQPYQYERRKIVGWRLLPIWIATRGLLDFKGLNIVGQALRSNIIKGVSNMKGSIIRLLKVV